MTHLHASHQFKTVFFTRRTKGENWLFLWGPKLFNTRVCLYDSETHVHIWPHLFSADGMWSTGASARKGKAEVVLSARMLMRSGVYTT